MSAIKRVIDELQKIYLLLCQRAATVFLVFALPVIVFHALAAPPLLAPDEWDHTARAIGLAQGQVFADKSADQQKTISLPKAYLEIVWDAHKEKLGKEQRFTWRAYEAQSDKRWKGQKIPAQFNSIGYFPLAYTPQVLVLKFSMMANFKIVASLRWGRLFLGVFYAGIGAMLIRLLDSGRLGLVALLSLPQVLFLFASFSPDASVILTGTAVIVVLNRVMMSDKNTQAAWVAAMGVAFFSAVKITYLPIGLMIALILLLKNKKYIYQSVTALVLSAFALVWGVFFAAAGSQPRQGIDAGEQLAFLFGHPGSIFIIAWRTLATDALHYPGEWIDYLNVPGIHPAYWFIVSTLVVLVAILVMDPVRKRGAYFPQAMQLVAALVLALGLSFGALYLAWTPVGYMGGVIGFQGRYLLPLLPFLLIILAPLPVSLRLRQAGLAILIPLWLVAAALSGIWLSQVNQHPLLLS